MSDKSAKKKALIIKKAREVFAEKGYLNVTMKDIVEACEISRGGLYLYFSGTEEIFLEVLNEPADSDEDNVFERAVKENATSSDILALFLQEQKRELLGRNNNLQRATYEFFFANPMPAKENPVKKQFDSAVAVIEKLIIDGVENGEFECEDPKGAARNMMYALEGLRIMSQTVGVSEKSVNREILYLLKGILKEEV
ncbi:MAG: TetR/AcrR family transcriptional regulator; helix-turn-helix transcriptional regulator [Lachnospiraceae bacterium]|nr:TetR/AcrR family transcriptional regulator; helix-turn-helix transcriptional regulator [Lachnospiraceae bacterium]